MMSRAERLLPNGIPRYIRCYDNEGKSSDRYTVVFTGRYRKPGGDFIYLGMSSDPYHPMGVGMHGFHDYLIDRPSYSHLGKKINFQDLPEKCKEAVISSYCEIWEIDLADVKPNTLEKLPHDRWY